MIRNILLVALRNMSRQWTYACINIAGLAVGIACSLVIFLFVYGEWSYDRGFDKADRIYRIGISFFNIGRFAAAPERLLQDLPEGFAGIERATRIQKDTQVILAHGDEKYVEPAVFYTDSSYFRVFSYAFVQGAPQQVLRGPHDVVLAADIAMKIFGRTDVVGETLLVGKEKTPYTVTGVVDPLPFKSHLQNNVWLSVYPRLTGEKAWSSVAFYSYVLLSPTSTEGDLQGALDQLFEKSIFPELGKAMGFKTLEEYRANDNAVRFFVHSLKDIYLKSDLSFELIPGGDESNIYVFSAVAGLVLILAAVNFVNLMSARATRRAKEVGVRKALGTSRRNLMLQFLGESLLTAFFALLLALVVSEVFLLGFVYVTGQPLLDTIWQQPLLVAAFAVFALLVGLLSGLYPAMVLTAFKPTRVLKGDLRMAGGLFFRNGLVVFQFAVSILLITGALVVRQQMHYMSNKNLGFDPHNVLTISGVDRLGKNATAYKTTLEGMAGVNLSGFHMGEPGNKEVVSISTWQTAGMEKPISFPTYFGDAHYLKLMGFRLKSGRDFEPLLASDTASVILNEAAVNALGLGDQPVGATVNKSLRVIGVVSDFHWESLRSAIAPAAIMLSNTTYQIGLRLQPEAVPDFLQSAESQWKSLVPDEPFRYHFVDDNFGKMLEKESVFGKAMNLFTLLAMFISGLGLYGLASYATEQRTKEVAIRKVMGASSFEITWLFHRRFSSLVLLSVALAMPVSIYLVQRWLSGFAYQTDVSPWLYLSALGMTFMVAWLAVGYHAWRASVINPAVTIQHE